MLPEQFHSFPLFLTQLLRYRYLYCHVLIALLMVIRWQLLHAIIGYFLFIIMLSAWIHFHPYVTIERFHWNF